MTYNELLSLGKVVARANPSAPTAYAWGDEKFTYEALDKTFSQNLNELHKEDPKKAYALMEQVITDVLPQKALEQYGQFAEIKTFAQGDKPVFVQRITEASRRRAKQFITKVGLAGVYEVFKLDGTSFEVPTTAIGGAAYVPYEEYLDGRVTMADVLSIVLEGMDEDIYKEIAKALVAAIDNLQATNKHSGSFDEKEMDRLLSIADSYGSPATIYCTFEFAASILPDTGWEGLSSNMKDTIWGNGYLGNYKGHRVIVLRQSYTDEKNDTKVIDPSYAWIIPGTADKPVKVAFEGSTHMREQQNQDWSTTIHVYQKVGVAARLTNDICVYQNTDLA